MCWFSDPISFFGGLFLMYRNEAKWEKERRKRNREARDEDFYLGGDDIYITIEVRED